MRFSVIVPTYNGATLLRRCVASLLVQDFPLDEYEIIIVDDCSTDDTVAVVQELIHTAGAHRMTYVRTKENCGPGHARNEGLRLARGSIVAFLDHDVYVARDWLARAADHLAHARTGGIEGRTMVPERDRATPFTHQTENRDSVVYRTCNIFYRREVFEAVGSFDERFYDRACKVHFREDADFAFRAMDAGWEIRFASDVLAFHPPLAPRWWRPLKLAERYMFDALLKQKHPRRYARELDRHRVLGLRTSRVRKKVYTAFLVGLAALIVGAVLGSRCLTVGSAWALALSYTCVLWLHIRKRTVSLRDWVLISVLALVVPLVYCRASIEGAVRYKRLAIV
jgi:glycosyltransferase involved in cell wall biosynthesis